MDLYLDFDDHSKRHRRGRRGYGRRNRSRKPWIIGIIIVLACRSKKDRNGYDTRGIFY